MLPPRQITDHEGHYARLGVAPSSPPETIAAAYRRKARLVHPDVPETGDADAFVELKRAYDVLSNPDRRAAYDRAGQPDSLAEQEPGEIGPMPFPEMTAPPTRHPKLRDLPVYVWAGMAVLLAIGLIEVGFRLSSSAAPSRREPIPAAARDVPPPSAKDPPRETLGPAPVRLAGTPNFYIAPSSTPAMLWRADDPKTLNPWGQLPAFSGVQAVRLHKPSGMVEVRVTDTLNGFVEAARLTPGNTAAASRAWCTYHAGPAPANGEVLSHAGSGPARLKILNRSGQPAAVKIRSADGGLQASVFLSPMGETVLEGLPADPARVEFATGEVWSRVCHAFSAGMRAFQLTGLAVVETIDTLSIPPGEGVATADLADQAFQRQ